jgi:excinuclease ABC subunit A
MSQDNKKTKSNLPKPSAAQAHHSLIVRGARAHNLKNITVEMPRDKLVVITGLSGSGKSSLAFDTIYAEGQRRYVESLSAYARQFLDMMQKPDVDSIEGLSPAISIEQKTTSKNPRSTVGTVTEIYDYMRLLWARIGIPYSPVTGLPIQAQTTSQMVDRILSMPEGTKLMILSPVVRGRKGEYRKEMLEWRKKGFQRIRVGDKFHELENPPKLDKQMKHDIEIVVDRIKVAKDIEQRLFESVETALNLSEGLLMIENMDTNEKQIFSSKFACPESGFTIEEIEPRLFSFNSPFGACPGCDGLGVIEKFTEELVVPNEKLSLRQGAIAPWSDSSSPYYTQTLDSLARHLGISLATPWNELEKAARAILLYGSEEAVKMTFTDGSRAYESKRPFEGILPNLERRYHETASGRVREDLSRYLSEQECKTCKGYRLKQEALAVKIDKKHIGQVGELSITAAVEWFSTLNKHLNKKENEIAAKILKEITERLFFLDNVGLTYLSLSRKSGTLSGGESQRIRLASQIGSGLTGVLYVLDEPSIGLHQRDNDRLLTTLKRLRDLGNTVIVVEHDEDAIRSADYLIDMGPGAGIHGGNVIAAGLPEEVFKNKNSITADYIMGRKGIAVPSDRREGQKDTRKGIRAITLEGATGNNLKDVSATFPLGTFTCVTGVSGSGKSTLTIDTLYAALAQRLNGERTHPAPFKKISGLDVIDKVIDIDQSPIGRTPRSNPATYTGAFTFIRDWYASLPESKMRGYQPGRFSFNVKGGRCEACQGDGLIKIEMHFLPDVYVTCDVCKGKRYSRETLEVKYKDKSIAEVLDMTVDEGAEFFKAVPSIREKMDTLKKVGLGYIHIGQQATTLSGGEAQRVKLSKELSKRATGRTVYILDEPTTGLHFEDTRKLLEVLQTLVEQGNTVIVIEHNLEVIKVADWIVDMGPEGGNGGGTVVAMGTPEDIVKVKASYTGQYLKPLLEKQKSKKRA